jgi:magnesium-transporting ATPase (P-type)
MLFEGAMQSVNNREEEVARVNDMMECKLSLVGATAIEDKLQNGVSSTI